MTVSFVAAGAGNITITSGGQLTLTSPASEAGDLLIAHLFYGGSTTSPTAPGDWTLLRGPDSLNTPATNGRTWVYGKIAAGTETTTNWGNPAVTTPRSGRIYRFNGVLNEAVATVVGGFGFAGPASSATISDQAVTTIEAGSLAVQLLAIADDNTMSTNWSGGSGGPWPNTPVVTAFTSTTGTPDTHLACYVFEKAAAGTIDGYSRTQSAADAWGITGFYIRAAPAAVVVTDTFDRANSSTIGNDSNGEPWAEVSGAWEIFTNSVRQTDTDTNPGELRCGTLMGDGTHWVEARLAASAGTGSIGLLARMDPTAFTGLSFEVADGSYKLIEVSGGTPNTVFTGAAHTHAASELYAFEVDTANNVRLYLDGVQVASTTSAFNAGDTRVGLHFNDDSTGSAAPNRWDSFRAGTGPYPGPPAGDTSASPEAAAATGTALDAVAAVVWPALVLMAPMVAP
jgi:hypothetical protein